MARSILPCHSIYDGDVAFAVALQDTDRVTPQTALRIGTAAGIAVERAILATVADE
jgi:L-aminopeptidase/D-esterase-like protein